MAKTSTVRARIEPRLKSDAESLFHRLGLTTTEAITMFYRQTKLHSGLPFEVVVPNPTTVKVFKNSDANIGLVRCEDAQDMFKKLEI